MLAHLQCQGQPTEAKKTLVQPMGSPSPLWLPALGEEIRGHLLACPLPLSTVLRPRRLGRLGGGAGNGPHTALPLAPFHRQAKSIQEWKGYVRAGLWGKYPVRPAQTGRGMETEDPLPHSLF